MATTKKNTIGILTGGGDCAGLNPAIKWIVNTALDPRLEQETGIKYEVVGIKEGWRGLAFTNEKERSEHVLPLNREMVSVWDRQGGTNLGTSRFNPYNSKNDQSKLVIDNIKSLGLDALIAIGGDDTLSVAAKLSKAGINVVGIPKTIDKDLPGTEYSLGFETAVETITYMVDSLRTTADSHSRVFVVEIMGRYAGWLTLKGGESSGASVILIPEFDFSVERVCQLITEKRKAGARYDIILVAEGAKPAGGTMTVKDGTTDSFGHKILGGMGEYLAKQITECTGIETRCVVPSHLQRGGIPCAYDRRMGRYFGIAAVNLITSKQFGKMVSLKNGQISTIQIEDVLGKLSLVDVNTMYDTANYNGCRNIY